jgi:hypothetical protein
MTAIITEKFRQHNAGFRNAYLGQHVHDTDNPNEDEIIGGMVPGTNDAGDPVLMTGSGRVTSAQASAAVDNAPWLLIFTEFPPLSAWKPPPL